MPNYFPATCAKLRATGGVPVAGTKWQAEASARIKTRKREGTIPIGADIRLNSLHGFWVHQFCTTQRLPPPTSRWPQVTEPSAANIAKAFLVPRVSNSMDFFGALQPGFETPNHLRGVYWRGRVFHSLKAPAAFNLGTKNPSNNDIPFATWPKSCLRSFLASSLAPIKVTCGWLQHPLLGPLGKHG